MVYDQDGLHPFIMVARMAVCAMLASDKGPMVTPLSGLNNCEIFVNCHLHCSPMSPC